MSDLDLIYSPIKIDALILYGAKFSLDIFLKLSENKYVKVCDSTDLSSHKLSILKKYKLKLIENAYLKRNDYIKFIQSIRQLLQDNLKNSKNENLNEQMKYLSTAHDVIRTVFKDGYINEDSKKIALLLTTETVKNIKRFNIFEKYEEFKNNCSNEYLIATLTSYLACAIIDKFSWSKDKIKEKVVLGAMLCDVLLSAEDFKIIYEFRNDLKALPKHILNHPLVTAQKIEEDSKFVSQESLNIIREHHERPNGKGYPHGVNYSNVTVLTAIYIIATYFVEQLFFEDLSVNTDIKVLNRLAQQVLEKFHSGNFKKASEALIKLYGSIEVE